MLRFFEQLASASSQYRRTNMRFTQRETNQIKLSNQRDSNPRRLSPSFNAQPLEPLKFNYHVEKNQFSAAWTSNSLSIPPTTVFLYFQLFSMGKLFPRYRYQRINSQSYFQLGHRVWNFWWQQKGKLGELGKNELVLRSPGFESHPRSRVQISIFSFTPSLSRTNNHP